MIGTDAYIAENSEIGSVADDANKDFVNTKICSDDITLIGPNVSIAEGIKVAGCSMVTRNIKKTSAEKAAGKKTVKGTATA